jgi:hypothetical protein
MTFPSVTATNTSQQGTTTTTHTVSMPSGSGGRLLMVLGFSGNPTLSGTDISGWTQIFVVTDSANDQRMYAHYRDSDPSGGTISITTNSAQVSNHRVWRISNADTSVAPASAQSASVGYDPPALNPAGWDVEDTLWITTINIFHEVAGLSITGFPASYTATGQLNGNAVGEVTTAWATRDNAVASENPGAFTASNEDGRGSVATIGIKPGVPALLPNILDTVTTFFNPSVVLSSQFVDPSVLDASVSFPGLEIATVMLPATLSAGVTLQEPTVVNLGTTQNIDPNVLDASAILHSPTVLSIVTVVRSIASASDDAVELPSSSADTDDTNLLFNTVGMYGGYRFTDVQVPNDVTILSTTISIRLTDTSKNDAEGTWYCEDADNPSTFTHGLDGDVDGRTKTTASIAWTTNDLGTSGTTIATPDLTTALEEVTDRAGWSPGNSMVFLYVHNSASDILIHSAFDSGSNVPFLTVTYLEQTETLFPGVIDASSTLLSPSIGADITVDVLSASATVLDPTVILFEQFIEPPNVIASAEFLVPTVSLGTIFLPGFEVLFEEDSLALVGDIVNEAAVQDTVVAAVVSESPYSLAFEE